MKLSKARVNEITLLSDRCEIFCKERVLEEFSFQERFWFDYGKWCPSYNTYFVKGGRIGVLSLKEERQKEASNN